MDSGWMENCTFELGMQPSPDSYKIGSWSGTNIILEFMPSLGWVAKHKWRSSPYSVISNFSKEDQSGSANSKKYFCRVQGNHQRVTCPVIWLQCSGRPILRQNVRPNAQIGRGIDVATGRHYHGLEVNEYSPKLIKNSYRKAMAMLPKEQAEIAMFENYTQKRSSQNTLMMLLMPCLPLLLTNTAFGTGTKRKTGRGLEVILQQNQTDKKSRESGKWNKNAHHRQKYTTCCHKVWRWLRCIVRYQHWHGATARYHYRLYRNKVIQQQNDRIPPSTRERLHSIKIYWQVGLRYGNYRCALCNIQRHIMHQFTGRRQ